MVNLELSAMKIIRTKKSGFTRWFSIGNVNKVDSELRLAKLIFIDTDDNIKEIWFSQNTGRPANSVDENKNKINLIDEDEFYFVSKEVPGDGEILKFINLVKYKRANENKLEETTKNSSEEKNNKKTKTKRSSKKSE